MTFPSPIIMQYTHCLSLNRCKKMRFLCISLREYIYLHNVNSKMHLNEDKSRVYPTDYGSCR